MMKHCASFVCKNENFKKILVDGSETVTPAQNARCVDADINGIAKSVRLMAVNLTLFLLCSSFF